MKSVNIQFIEQLAVQLSAVGVKYRFIDNRWKKRGDVDIIVARDSSRKFEAMLRASGFTRKGMWPPQSRAYKGVCHGEIISIGGHIGGYIGGFGGGLGGIGRILEPKTVIDGVAMLSAEERCFVLMYKYASRTEKEKYVTAYEKIYRSILNETKLIELVKHVFVNAENVAAAVVRGDSLSVLPLEFVSSEKRALWFRGKPNKLLKRLYKVFFPGQYIALVGCNGTGKSTTVKNLAENLISENIEVSQVYSGRMQFQMLPINYFLRFFKPQKVSGKKNPVGSKEEYAREVRVFTSSTLNFVAPFVFYVEYFLRYIFQIYPRRVFHDVVLVDRGFIDLFSSPNLNKKVCRVLFALLPKPRHVLLYNDVDVLLARRPEFLREHVVGQLDAYNQFDRAGFYMMKVKTDSFAVVDEIKERIGGLL